MQLMFLLIALAVVAGFVGVGIGVAEGSTAIILGSLVLSGVATFFGIQLRRRILSDRQSS
ncbi:MAG: DUF5325 family protein [Exiguobacterium marinum]|uniref:DUF5325 family protein n=1 Tax=Exiguobacterium marinum TaxID=273528 RepID=A0ABY7X188_9BACL|nr:MULTISPECIES: DUF5325 family protein [Exiguobacterium]WDH76884.1 DUF5325 family protein [Exiguobacterium marinum]